jgi:soluble lytic murein transglycosylase-like protein
MCPAKTAIWLLGGILLVWALPARGQIVSVVDENGKRVFINADPPSKLGGNPGRATSSGARLVPASTRTRAERAEALRRLSKDQLEKMAHEAAERHRLDPALVKAVIEAESNWNPEAVSSKGAQGLMQLIPGTAESLGVNDAFDPAQNLDGGVRHLRALLEKYDGDLEKALAAYNAGAGAVDRAGGVPNYRETRDYVQKVTDSYFRPGSGRSGSYWSHARSIYRTVDERGRVVFTNE